MVLLLEQTSSTYSATSTGTYSLTETSPNGCITISNGIPVIVLSTAVPSSLFTSNIELNKGYYELVSCFNAHHYDIRMRVQGGLLGQYLLTIYLHPSRQSRRLIYNQLPLMSGQFVLLVVRIHLVHLLGQVFNRLIH